MQVSVGEARVQADSQEQIMNSAQRGRIQAKRKPGEYAMPYASCGPILWPFLRSSARDMTIEAVRGTIAIKGIRGN